LVLHSQGIHSFDSVARHVTEEAVRLGKAFLTEGVGDRHRPNKTRAWPFHFDND